MGEILSHISLPLKQREVEYAISIWYPQETLGRIMKKVLTYGTSDLIHKGHIYLLQRAKVLGDHLTVALSTDEFNWEQKNKICVQPYEERKLILESLRFVDEVIPEQNWKQKIHE